MSEPAFEDLTARARIRDAALRMFTERGIEGATIRDIARAAGVSGGLVRHHFGSKEALREACDTYALDRLMQIKKQAYPQGQPLNLGFLPDVHPTVLLLNRYLARSLVDGSPAVAGLFDEMVKLGEQWIDEHNPGQFDDPWAYSAVLVAMQTGMLAMQEHLSRALGADILSPDGHLRLARAMLEFYSQPLLTPEMARRATEVIDKIRSREAS
jgi:AcrR family transcriptional regulator